MSLSCTLHVINTVLTLQKGQGKIDKEDLQEVCRQFKLDLSGPLLDSLMEYCDVDKDGHISFLEFANFLSWKDQMPIGRLEQGILTKGEHRWQSIAVNMWHRWLATDWRNKSLNCDDKELTDNLLLTCTLQIKIELDLH